MENGKLRSFFFRKICIIVVFSKVVLYHVKMTILTQFVSEISHFSATLSAVYTGFDKLLLC